MTSFSPVCTAGIYSTAYKIVYCPGALQFKEECTETIVAQ